MENIYITVPDEQAKEICDVLRKKLQTEMQYRSGDLAAAIKLTLGNFCHCTAEKVVAT